VTTQSQIERWYRAALAAANPATAVERALRRNGRDLLLGETRVPVRGRLDVAGVGKAAPGMAGGAARACGDLITAGFLITKDGHADGAPPAGFVVREAAHPIPDERGVAATRELLALLDGLNADDVVLALISGGGSALLEAPRLPATLTDLAAVTDLLLRAGAPIGDLNAVRGPLSLVKGGGLRRAAAPARVLTLILSDVLGNDPAVIASGPTVPSAATATGALRVLDRYGLLDRVPAPVRHCLERPPNPDRAGEDGRPDPVLVVADNATAVAAARAAAEAGGRRVAVAWTAATGEAADLGRAWVAACAAAPPGTDILLGGGEATVTVTGAGVGGRNTEFALAAALALEDHGVLGWTIASLATDGQDGPTGVAGAIADAGTARRTRAAGVDPLACLRENDSLRVFQAAGGVVAPGPTGTNVNDLYVAVRVGDGGNRRSGTGDGTP